MKSVLASGLAFFGGPGSVADRQSGIEPGLGGPVARQTLVKLALEDRQQLDRKFGNLGGAQRRQVVRCRGVLGERHERVSVSGGKGLEGGHHAASGAASRSSDSEAVAPLGLGRAMAM